MNYRNVTLCTGICLIALVSGHASAQDGFVWKPAQSPAQVVVQGFGDNLPLAIALQQIVPVHVHMDIDPTVADTMVSWRGGRQWKDVVSEMARSVNLVANIDDSTVTIRRAAVQHASAGSPMSILPGAASSQAGAVAVTPVAAPAPLVNPSQITVGAPIVSKGSMEVWEVRTGKTLREELNLWAERAQWRVIYKMTMDYPIESSAVFVGDFEEAVKKLMQAMQMAKPAPRAGFAPDNRTLVIVSEAGESN
jgi:hypothetical protein